jgi:23S rRNA pseudouridine2605 synthase
VRDTHSIVEVAASVAELVVEKITGASVRGRRVQARLDAPRGERPERSGPPARGGSDRPARSGPPRGDRPSRPFGDRPARPADRGDRPARPYGAAPRGDRPDRGERPARPFNGPPRKFDRPEGGPPRPPRPPRPRRDDA